MRSKNKIQQQKEAITGGADTQLAWQKYAIPMAVLLITSGLFGLCLHAAMLPAAPQIETYLLRFSRTGITRATPLTWLATAIQYSSWIIAGACVVLYIAKAYRLVWRLAVAVLLSSGLAFACQMIVGNTMPTALVAYVNGDTIRFPSVLVTQITVASLMFATYFSRAYKILFLPWVLLACWSSVYMAIDTPLGAGGGLLLGSTVVAIFWLLLSKLQYALQFKYHGRERFEPIVHDEIKSPQSQSLEASSELHAMRQRQLQKFRPTQKPHQVKPQAIQAPVDRTSVARYKARKTHSQSSRVQ